MGRGICLLLYPFYLVIEIGINDCGYVTLHRGELPESLSFSNSRIGRAIEEIAKQVFDLMDVAYEAGARQFIITDVPPIQRFPGGEHMGSKLLSDIDTFPLSI